MGIVGEYRPSDDLEEALKDVIVIAGYTYRNGLLVAYEKQLADAEIEFCFEMMPNATSNFDMEKRIAYWRELALRFSDYEQIVVTDAWDVLFFGTKEDLLSKPKTMMISAERHCFPGPQWGEEDFTDVIKGPTKWRYSNPGMLVANPSALLEWLDVAAKSENCWSDQAWFNRRLADGTVPVSLDATTELFYVVSSVAEDEALQLKDGRFWNSTCDTYPNFFHFAGHGADWVQRVLPGHTPLGQEYKERSLRLIRSYLEAR